jgi:hypothetical protein
MSLFLVEDERNVDLIYGFPSDPDETLEEQAFNVLRNLAESEDGIDTVFYELDAEMLITHLETALQSSEDDVVIQVSLSHRVPHPQCNPASHTMQVK